MIVKIGDMFSSKCTTIVNTINCVGVMGKGIALEFKKRYPDMYTQYVKKCNSGEVKPGAPYLYDNGDIKIINFPTKDHWRSPSRLSYVIDGLDWFVNNYEKMGIDSIAFPPLGCGNGGLTWRVVGPIMYSKLKELPIRIEIYAPFGTNPKELSTDFLEQESLQEEMLGSRQIQVNSKWYLILQVIKELNNREYSLKVGRTIYQKICYVLTRNGVDTGFVFSKGEFGPYSPQAKESIVALANANLIVEKQLGRMISLSVADGVVLKKDRYTEEEWNAVVKTVDLFARVKRTEQAEMIATVLYAYDQLALSEAIISDKDIYDYVLNWKTHWKQEKEYEVRDTIHNLAMLSLMKIVHDNEMEPTMFY